MKVKFTYEPFDLSWTNSITIDVQDNVSHADIQAMFPIVLNVPYNKYECSYKSVDGKHIFTDDEIYAYSE